ncbi:MAG: hypothetical protein HKN42_15680 [Granulosicoccus sp.]|nr:hypothetical protein [Granulosicoccus sp.]
MSLGLCAILAACDSDLQTDTFPATGSPNQPGNPEVPETADGHGTASNGAITLQVGSGSGGSAALVEGGGAVTVPVSLARLSGTTGTIQLTAGGETSADERDVSWEFTDASLSPGEGASNLVLQLAIGSRPIRNQTRRLIVTADDGTDSLSASVDVVVQPTSLPDVYLLVGQSNMMGFSEDDSKQASPGGADAPNERIRQLNVTGNDDANFTAAADFTTPARLYNAANALTIAVDPLHDTYDESLGGKTGQRIGPGLSFAKSALADTTADIVLVPAAWSDTGFCKRASNRLPGIGWNATQKSNAALSGTLLYERAVARANIALEESGGVLRGILWHQGEADSDDAACAQSYADNLAELATALRSNIDIDARGASARGANADIPFIAGTMSMGNESPANTQIPFNSSKQLVDDTHRNIASLIPLADYVNNDDLVPPGYPCGEGSCVHFGAAAYREMGQRYYQQLIGLLPR